MGGGEGAVETPRGRRAPPRTEKPFPPPDFQHPFLHPPPLHRSRRGGGGETRPNLPEGRPGISTRRREERTDEERREEWRHGGEGGKGGQKAKVARLTPQPPPRSSAPPPTNPTVPRHHCPPAHGGLGYPFVVIMLWGRCGSLQQGRANVHRILSPLCSSDKSREEGPRVKCR